MCSAGRLENNYLPPNNAPTSGGNGQFLTAPSAAAAAEGPATPPVPILKNVNENNGDGSYNFE